MSMFSLATSCLTTSILCWCINLILVDPKGNQSRIFTERTDAEAETSILRPPDVKNWLIGKDPDAGKDWRQGEKGMTEDEMVGWHHWLCGCELKWAPGVGDGQGSLAYYSPWGREESDTTEQLNWIELMDLTFQVPMKYCSLQHWNLLPSPVTSTSGRCFCFGSISSFLLELFLHSSPVVYWATQWHRTPVLLPGKSRGWRILVGFSPWGR